MADAKHLARDLAQTDAERDAIFVGGMGHDARGVETLRRSDGADAVGIQFGSCCAQVQTPGTHGRTDTFRDAVVSREHIVQTFVQQHFAGLIQPVQQSDRRRIGIGIVGIAFGHVRNVEKGAGQGGCLGSLYRARPKAYDRKAGR